MESVTTATTSLEVQESSRTNMASPDAFTITTIVESTESLQKTATVPGIFPVSSTQSSSEMLVIYQPSTQTLESPFPSPHPTTTASLGRGDGFSTASTLTLSSVITTSNASEGPKSTQSTFSSANPTTVTKCWTETFSTTQTVSVSVQVASNLYTTNVVPTTTTISTNPTTSDLSSSQLPDPSQGSLEIPAAAAIGSLLGFAALVAILWVMFRHCGPVRRRWNARKEGKRLARLHDLQNSGS